MTDIINYVRPLKDEEIKINMTPKEAKRVFDFLGEKLKGSIQPTVHLDTNNYRGFWSCFKFSKEYHYVLTWNEALRFHSYLRFYLEREKSHELNVTMSQIRNFPVYGLTTKGKASR